MVNPYRCKKCGGFSSKGQDYCSLCRREITTKDARIVEILDKKPEIEPKTEKLSTELSTTKKIAELLRLEERISKLEKRVEAVEGHF